MLGWENSNRTALCHSKPGWSCDLKTLVFRRICSRLSFSGKDNSSCLFFHPKLFFPYVGVYKVPEKSRHQRNLTDKWFLAYSYGFCWVGCQKNLVCSSLYHCYNNPDKNIIIINIHWVLTISWALLKPSYALFHFVSTKEHFKVATTINPYCICEDRSWQSSAHGPNPAMFIRLPTMAESRSPERECNPQSWKDFLSTLYEVLIAAITKDHRIGGSKQHKCITLWF